jgi:hypothetical protein
MAPSITISVSDHFDRAANASQTKRLVARLQNLG